MEEIEHALFVHRQIEPIINYEGLYMIRPMGFAEDGLTDRIQTTLLSVVIDLSKLKLSMADQILFVANGARWV